ncbi:DUF309 domain-containing protein [Paenibacillus flagellatus]|uniref:DUF309 domain-containing protein n=1 Tax=Paenibacillus flagellatus TaxID=2211139 RepID=A0A2V5KA61_9BACL|nr:DUF309 domain-containing protein [Paenibacillus flagellatus]PYI56475.1 DUF309 domain-containing protein [Paenibacillus flagellatus]
MFGYDLLYVEFLYYFNVERDYFECHEVMEELWLEEGRNPLYQGLLQVAVGLYHHRNGNVGGAIKLLSQSLEKLEFYPRQTMGIDLGKLVDDTTAYLAKLERIEEEPFDFYDLDITIVHSELAAMVEELKQFPPEKSGE